MEPDFRDRLIAIGDDLHSLALLHDREPSRGLLTALKEVSFPENLSLHLTSSGAVAAREFFMDFFARIDGGIDQHLLDILYVDFADIYLSFNFGVAPAELPWTAEGDLQRQESLFAVRQFYRQRDLKVPDWARRSDDHIVHQLQFLAYLMEIGDDEAIAEAVAFLDNHPLKWVGHFAQVVVKKCRTSYFAGSALISAAYLAELRQLLGKLSDAPPIQPKPASHEQLCC